MDSRRADDRRWLTDPLPRAAVLPIMCRKDASESNRCERPKQWDEVRWVWLFCSDARLGCKIEFLVAVEVVAA
jgi:hypothetical protein